MIQYLLHIFYFRVVTVKVISLYGHLVTEEEIMTIVIVTGIPIPFGRYLSPLLQRMAVSPGTLKPAAQP